MVKKLEVPVPGNGDQTSFLGATGPRHTPPVAYGWTGALLQLQHLSQHLKK